MDKVVALFFIGLALGISIPITEKLYQNVELANEPITLIQTVFVAGSKFWYLAITVITLIVLPVAIFKTLRNYMTRTEFLPLPLMTGVSFAFTFMGLLGFAIDQL